MLRRLVPHGRYDDDAQQHALAEDRDQERGWRTRHQLHNRGDRDDDDAWPDE